MIYIDKVANYSPLRSTNPMEKFLFSIITLIVILLSTNLLVYLFVITIMASLVILKGKVCFSKYFKLLLIPIGFLVIGTITIAIGSVAGKENVIFSINIFNLSIGCTKENFVLSMKLFLKSLGGVSCLYFLILTTPMHEILMVLKKMRFPKLFIELMGLIYRFIFILLNTSNMIFISQNSRLGYESFKTSINSLGKLIVSLLITAYRRSEAIYIAMESRCYEGEIELLDNDYKVSYMNMILIVTVEVVLIFIENTMKIFGGMT